MDSNEKRVIGLILPLWMEFTREMIKGVSSYRDQDPRVELHILSKDERIPDPEDLPVNLDGVLAFRSSKDINKLKRLAPHVVTTSNLDPALKGDFVISDDVATGRMGAEHLIRRGYRNLIFAGIHNHTYSKQRYQGFCERAAEAGVEDVQLINLKYEKDAWHLPELLNHMAPRCGVMAANDYVATTLVNATEDNTNRIPRQFAVLGVDNDALQLSMSSIPISSIELGGVTIGYEAIKRLVARIDNPKLTDEGRLIPPLRIQTRLSTDAYALEDELAAQALRVMEKNLRDLHDVGDVIKKLDVPRRTLEHRFRNATGKTLARELASLRVEKARELLHQPDLDIEAVAMEVGLPDARMIWLLFKRLTGETPSAYRKRLVPGY
jgi:LacI family transcriptional regulator